MLNRIAASAKKQVMLYSSTRAVVKARQANEVFEAMTYEERRALCLNVFNGQLPDGQRMGVFISWDSTGKRWRYQIEGHLIDASGPPKSKAYFDAEPDFDLAESEDINVAVNSPALQKQGKAPLERGSFERVIRWCW